MNSKMEKYKKGITYDLIGIAICLAVQTVLIFLIQERSVLTMVITISMGFYLLFTLITLPYNIYKYMKYSKSNTV
jgi:hypothetical protein